QHQGAARRGLAGPAEVRRGGAAAARRLRGAEAAGGKDPPAKQIPADSGCAAVGATLRGDGKGCGSGRVAEATGGDQTASEVSRETTMTEKALFLEALARSPAERAAFLDEACAGRPELRAGVEALLAAHESSGVLDQPAVAVVQAVEP